MTRPETKITLGGSNVAGYARTRQHGYRPELKSQTIGAQSQLGDAALHYMSATKATSNRPHCLIPVPPGWLHWPKPTRERNKI
jgi:hypothetical protein